MARPQKSNKEDKKKPVMSMKEKRAAKKSKQDTKGLLGHENTQRRPTPATKRH